MSPSSSSTLSLGVQAIASQLALAAPAVAHCNGIERHAHGGRHAHPENSATALLNARRGPYHASEIDIQRLEDGTWVLLQHDIATGRTAHTGTPRPVTNLSSRIS